MPTTTTATTARPASATRSTGRSAVGDDLARGDPPARRARCAALHRAHDRPRAAGGPGDDAMGADVPPDPPAGAPGQRDGGRTRRRRPAAGEVRGGAGGRGALAGAGPAARLDAGLPDRGRAGGRVTRAAGARGWRRRGTDALSR